MGARGWRDKAREQSKCMWRELDKGAGLGQIVRVESRERILPNRLQNRFAV
jgi:hypothetical protein